MSAVDDEVDECVCVVAQCIFIFIEIKALLVVCKTNSAKIIARNLIYITRNTVCHSKIVVEPCQLSPHLKYT